MKCFYLRGTYLAFVLAGCVLLSFSGCKKVDNRPHISTGDIKSPGQMETKISSNTAQPESRTSQNIDSETDTDVVIDDFKPFPVYSDKGARDNHFVPSGFMPNGKCLRFNDFWKDNCHEGETCLQIVYDVECSRSDQRWAGIYWLNPPNNWGHRKGGFNLTGAKRLTFWARGERGGEQIQEFTMGGISGDYPDSDIATIGPVILTDQWRKYTIDLRGKDLSYISGGFAWSTNEEVNPEGCVFYLDDIRFE